MTDIFKGLLFHLLLGCAAGLSIVAAQSPQPVEGRSIHVAKTGNDASAVPGDLRRPFGTLTAAFAALRNGDHLIIGEGTYEVTPGYPNQWYSLPDYAPMQLKNLTNVTVRGAGSVEIFGRGPGDFLMIENCRNVRVENLTFRGDRPSIPDGGSLFSTILLRAENDSLHFENLRIVHFGNHGISHLFGPKWSKNMVVTNCYFSDGGDGEMEPLGEDGAAISGISSDSIIVNNYIERCYRGIEIEGAFGYAISNITITGNVLTNCHTFGIMLFGTGYEGHEYSNIIISSNKILNMANDPRVSPRLGFGIWLGAGQNMVVANNLVDTFSGPGGGISVMSAFLPVTNVVVASNTVRNVGLRGIQVFQQYSNSLQRAWIHNNTVYGSGDEGILLNGVDLVCASNIVQECGWQRPLAGIAVENRDLGSVRPVFLDNVVRNNDRPITTYGISIAHGVEDAFLTGNRFESLNSTNILDLGERTEILPKIISIEHEVGQVVVTVTGRAGVNRNLQLSRDFHTWTTLANGVSSPNGLLRFVHDVSEIEGVGGGRRRPLVYRIEAPPAP